MKFTTFLNQRNSNIFKNRFVTESRVGSKLKKAVKDVDNEKSLKDFYDILISELKGNKYDKTVEIIDEIISDPKLKFILSLGFGGKFSELKLKVNKISLNACDLIPTQSEIGLEESYKFIMLGNNIDKCFSEPCVIKHPIVTFQNTFIVDGHHRWSEIYITNPSAKIECVNISANIGIISLLKAIQSTIGSNIGNLNLKSTKGKNIYKMNKKELKDYIVNNITDNALNKLKEYYNDPILALVNNGLKLKFDNKPIKNAINRDIMPQTSKDPNLFDDLKKGVVDLK